MYNVVITHLESSDVFCNMHSLLSNPITVLLELDDQVLQSLVICSEEVQIVLNLSCITLYALFVSEQLIHTHCCFLQIHLSTLPRNHCDVFIPFQDPQLLKDTYPLVLCLLEPLSKLNVLLLLLPQLLVHVLVDDICHVAIFSSPQTCLEVSHKLYCLDQLVIQVSLVLVDAV